MFHCGGRADPTHPLGGPGKRNLKSKLLTIKLITKIINHWSPETRPSRRIHPAAASLAASSYPAKLKTKIMWEKFERKTEYSVVQLALPGKLESPAFHSLGPFVYWNAKNNIKCFSIEHLLYLCIHPSATSTPPPPFRFILAIFSPIYLEALPPIPRFWTHVWKWSEFNYCRRV